MGNRAERRRDCCPEAGANRLEIAVAAIPVSLPSFASMEFVTVP
ncbi:MAG: hypothetical protein R2873_28280 [Caldilineaceae bacterium]